MVKRLSYIADTNVISELMKAPQSADPAVIAWIDSHPGAVFVTSITTGELCYGVRRLPAGKKREQLAAALGELLERIDSLTLSYNLAASKHWGELKALSVARGRTATTEDLQIAAIARANGMAVATRNVKDFDYLDIEVVNPFVA
jgi:predicted nucleic acid-binding protein